MSYAPDTEQAVRDEANHQLAYGSRAAEEQHIIPDSVGRTVIYKGSLSALAGDTGVILKHGDHIFLRHASNGVNHMRTTRYDENDSLSMMDVKHDENGMAMMKERDEESDIVSYFAIKNVKNDTGMDLLINFIGVRAAGTGVFVEGCRTVSDIVPEGTNFADAKELYALEIDGQTAEFAGLFFGSTASSVVKDVDYGSGRNGVAAVRVGSPVLHFHDNHQVGGVPVNVHSSKLPLETRFGEPHVLMESEKAKMYVAKAQKILDHVLAHADVRSSRFAVQVRRLQKNLPPPDPKKTGRLSFDIEIEYVNTRS